MQKRIIVVGIVTDGNKILLGKKAKGQPPYPDFWHTIGGGVKDLERAEKLVEEKNYDDQYLHEELRREIREEAGITIKNIKNICPRYKDKPRKSITKNKQGIDTGYVFLEYLCELDYGKAVPSDDIAELIWVEKSNLKDINLTPPSVEMYKELGWM